VKRSHEGAVLQQLARNLRAVALPRRTVSRIIARPGGSYAVPGLLHLQNIFFWVSCRYVQCSRCMDHHR